MKKNKDERLARKLFTIGTAAAKAADPNPALVRWREWNLRDKAMIAGWKAVAGYVRENFNEKAKG